MQFIEFVYLSIGGGILLLVVNAFFRKPPTRDTGYIGGNDGISDGGGYPPENYDYRGGPYNGDHNGHGHHDTMDGCDSGGGDFGGDCGGGDGDGGGGGGGGD